MLMIDYQQAKLNPTSVFNAPQDVLDNQDFTREQKIKILKCWEYDAHELQIAEEENMPAVDSDVGDMLQRVLAALRELESA